MFLRLQRAQEIIIILDNGAKCFSKNFIELEWWVTTGEMKIIKEKDIKSFICVPNTFQEDIEEK